MTENAHPTLIAAPGEVVSFVRLLEPLGKPGEQGEVWLAHAPHDANSEFTVKFAVKFAKRSVSALDDPGYQRFRAEFNVLATLDHRNIIRVYTCGLHTMHGRQYPYYIMEYLGPQTTPFNDALQAADAPSKLELTISVLLEVAAALRHVHHHDQHHGDVKASNILVTTKEGGSRQVKLIDFGFGPLLGVADTDAPDVEGARPQRASSRIPPARGRTPKHVDVWQFAFLFREILSELAPAEAPPAIAGVTRGIDYDADFPRLVALLERWSEDHNKAPLRASPSVVPFYQELEELDRAADVSDLPSGLKGSLRHFGVAELSTASKLLPAFEAMRIPPRQLILYTERIKSLITAPEFGALRYTRQLGFTHLVYPGAQGTRFEHCLGVYNLACQFVIRLASQPAFRRLCPDQSHITVFLLAALLHDVGHFPYAHQLEEFKATEVEPEVWTRIERLAEGHVAHGRRIIGALMTELAVRSFNLTAADIPMIVAVAGLGGSDAIDLPAPLRFLKTLLDGPIDLDKLDYVERDAHHCGVPYGNYLDLSSALSTPCKSLRIRPTDYPKSLSSNGALARWNN